jgi:hypothetical protein
MRRFFFVIWLLLIVGGVVWYIRYAPESPSLSLANLQGDKLSFSPQKFVKDMDSQIAQTIRSVSDNGIQLSQVGSSQVLNDVKSATISASVTTSPEELWKAVREEGAKSVVTSLASSANVSVNDVSADIVHEARYQYCQGVVDEYQRNSGRKPSF